MKVWFMVICMAISGSLFAQNYNLGFEEWGDTMWVVSNPINNCSMPLNAEVGNENNRLTNWTVNNGVLRTTDAYSGDYAAVVCIWYIHATGKLKLGEDCLDDCKIPVPEKVYGLSGYYKYVADSFQANDLINKKAIVYLKTFRTDTITGTQEVLSYDSLEFSQKGTYTYFQIRSTFTDTTAIPDSVSLSFESQNNGVGGCSCSYAHFLYLDDLAFHFSPMPTTSIKEDGLKKKLKISPNPATGKINMEYIKGLKILQIQLTNTSGKTVRTFYPNQKQLDITGIPAGNYFLRVVSNEGEITKQIAIY